VKVLKKGIVLSMASVKVLSHNTFLFKLFILVLEIKPEPKINQKLWKEAIKFAAITA